VFGQLADFSDYLRSHISVHTFQVNIFFGRSIHIRAYFNRVNEFFVSHQNLIQMLLCISRIVVDFTVFVNASDSCLEGS